MLDNGRALPRAPLKCLGMIAALWLLLLSACAGDSAPADSRNIAPPLYEIIGPDGSIEGWMLGTIHALPDDTPWRTATISSIIDDADALLVEVAALDNDAELAATFARLGTAAQPIPIAQRVPHEHAAAAVDLAQRTGLAHARLDGMETWAAALTLAQVEAGGDAANGVDRALIRAFAGRKVEELEGIPAQLAIFNRLSERDQRTLLTAVVANADIAQSEAARLRAAWLAGDSGALAKATRSGILADPALRDTLLVRRNRAWAAVIIDRLHAAPRPLIAVGAAHIVGDDGLPRLLEREGYTLRKLPRPAPPAA